MVMTCSFFLDDFWFMMTFCAANCLHHKDTKCFKSFWMLFFVIFVTFMLNKYKFQVRFYIHDLNLSCHPNFAIV